VDEAGMLDQDTARALPTIAGESAVRVALLGKRQSTCSAAGSRWPNQ
jgi:exodeoxyribonuclease V alpha subunit